MYWFYRNWKHLKRHKGLSVKPGWYTVGLFVPILGLVLAYNQLRTIRALCAEAGTGRLYSPSSILVSWLLLSSAWRLPDPFWLVSFVSVFPLAVVQGALNAYWEKEHPGLPTRRGLSGAQIALLVVGGIALALTAIGMLAPE